MIIRSQNKKELHNLNGIKMIGIVTNSQDFFVDVNGQHCIGVYSTEEKAIKVLDMIQKAYNSIETMKIDKGAWRDNHYFEMPQDNEV